MAGKGDQEPREPVIWQALRWLLLAWWIALLSLLGNIAYNVAIAFIQGGPTAAQAQLSWGYLAHIEQANPSLFLGVFVLLTSVSVLGAGLSIQEWQKEQRAKRTRETEHQDLKKRVGILESDPDQYDPQVERAKYIEGMRAVFQGITLPIDPGDELRLAAIYQPLQLVSDPLVADQLRREDRRIFEDEAEIRRAAERLRRERETPSGQDASADEATLRPVPRSEPPKQATNIADALRQSGQRRIIVLGNPGTGKTTTLRQTIEDALAHLDAPDAPLPIFIALPDLARAKKIDQLAEYMAVVAEKYSAKPAFGKDLWAAVISGQALVCLDGLDEVPKEDRQALIDRINNDARVYGGTWVIGSRFSEYQGKQFAPGQFAEWELKPLAPEQQDQLAQALLRELHRFIDGPQGTTVPRLNAQLLLKKLAATPQTAAWRANPLLLSLAAYVFVKQGGSLPETRTTLYTILIDGILEAHIERGTKWPFAYGLLTIREALAEVAVRLFAAGGRTFDLADLMTHLRASRQALDANWHRGDEAMALDLIHCGLLDEVAKETYGFRHLTFQEFLVARGLAAGMVADAPRQTRAWELSRSHRTHSRWNEALRLLVGVLAEMGKPPATQALQRWFQELLALQQANDDPGLLHLGLAIRSMNELSSLTMHTLGLATAAVDVWSTAIIDAAGRERSTLLQRLISLGPEIARFDPQYTQGAIESFVVALEDGNWQIRQAAAQALGQLGERMPVDALLGALGDDYANVRAAAAQALGRRTPNPVEKVRDEGIAVLLDHRSGTIFGAIVQREFAEVLGNMRQASAISTLATLLEWPYWSVQASAARSLGKIRRIVISPKSAEIIERLQHLRHVAYSQVVNDAADDALAEILTLDENVPEE